MFNQYGYMPNYGYAPQQPLKAVQPLTQEEINHLRNKSNDFTNVSLTQDELLKCKCTHKDKTGRMTLTAIDPNNPSNVCCEICGACFNTERVNPEEINLAVATIQNVLQQTKLQWLDIPQQVATDYMMIEPLLDKVVNLYAVANDHFDRYYNGAYMQPMPNGGYGTGFDAVNNIVNYGGMPYGPQGYQQPMGQPQMQYAPQGYQQPMMQPQMQYAPQGYQQPMMQPQMMGGNPFGYEVTNPQMQQAPVQQAAPVGAPVPPPAAQPAAPAAAEPEIKVTKQFTV